MTDKPAPDGLLESSWARIVMTLPLWAARVTLGIVTRRDLGGWIAAADIALVVASGWALLPMAKAQGQRFPDRTTLATLPLLGAIWALALLLVDLWRWLQDR
jgi:hypothetical protein